MLPALCNAVSMCTCFTHSVINYLYVTFAVSESGIPHGEAQEIAERAGTVGRGELDASVFMWGS